MDTKRFNIFYVLLALIGIFLVTDFWTESRQVADRPNSECQTLVKEDKVTEVVVTPDNVRGKLREPRDGKTEFITTRVDPELAAKLQEHGVKVRGSTNDTLMHEILAWVLPV